MENTADDRSQMCAELQSRAGFYRMLSRLYYRAFTQDELDALSSESLKGLSEDTANELMSEGFNDMYRYLRKRNTGTREDLGVDFTRCFMGSATYRGLSGMPYASLFLGTEGQLMGAPRKAVRAFFKKERIKLEEGVDLPEDHLSFEFEFLAILNERAARALAERFDSEAIAQLDLQRKFLSDHVLSWVDRFFNLSGELLRTRFYRGAIKVTRGFLSDELDTISFLSSEIRMLSQSAA